MALLPLSRLGLVACASIALSAGATLAASEAPRHPRQFGGGAPVLVGELPRCDLRTRLERLPAAERAKALATLSRLRFHEDELDSLRVDAHGDVAYACFFAAPPKAAATTAATAAAPTTATASVPISSPPAYHSRPGSRNVAYLDFNGYTITGTAWNSGAAASYQAVPFDLDGDPTTFSDAEQTAMREIWERVSEDYAPFDLDITTQEPATWNQYTGRILVTRHIDANGQAMPSSTAGGVSYVNTFGGSSFAYYSPSLVYYDNLADEEDYIAEASAHEFGHALGLSHQGTTTSAYFGGMGSGPTSWGPIMGTGYNRNVSQWAKGEYPNANDTEDELAIIATHVPYRADDDGDTTATAASVAIAANGSFSVSGVIGTTADVDVFRIAPTGTGTLTVNARSYHCAEHTSGGDLDIRLRLLDADGNQLVDADPAGQVDASLTASVSPGTYYLWIDGVGDPTTGYSDYASLGQYTISGTAPVGSGQNPVIGNGTGLAGQYWSNQLKTFTGGPTLTRTDATVDFDWGSGSPDPSISSDRFTARWSGQVQAETSETYTFTTTGDDGVRLWVNGMLLVDSWTDQGPTDHSGSIALSAGQKVSIQMDYYEDGGGAVAKLSWSTPIIARQIVPQTQLYPATLTQLGNGTGLAGQYWSNQLATFTGAPTLTRTDATVDFDWGSGSPDPSISSDRFTARWSGQVQALTSETYTFTTTGDDGVRLWVNGTLLIDAWYDQAPTDHSGSIALSAGQKVSIQMDYYEDGGGAVAKLSWSTPTIARQIVPRTQLYPATLTQVGNGTGLTAQYWSNQLATFTGAPTLTRTDATVDFDWGSGSPDPSITSDHFTARWSGQVQAPTSETYTFTTTGDDGVRLWVNGTLLIDAWYDQGPTDHSGSIALSAGQKATIQMDYYENGGGAVAKLGWSTPTIARQIVPQSQLYPAATGGGTGLTGAYWSNQLATFDGAATITRLDATVDFDWGTGSPDPSVTVDRFTARWTGSVQAATSETYTFTVTGDDGVRLWVDGQLIVDAWYDEAPADHGGSIALTAGQRVSIQLDYYENGGGAVAKLSWSTPTIARQIVPTSALYPATGAIEPPIPTGITRREPAKPDDDAVRIDAAALDVRRFRLNG